MSGQSDSNLMDPEVQQGALLALSSTASRMDTLMAPDASCCAPLMHELAALPLQLHYVAPDSAFGLWLAIAALAEQKQQLELARTIIDGIRHAVETDAIHESVSLERRAICWSRRGRIARTRGAHDDAFECYFEARRLVRDLPWHDARPVAELGLGVLAAVKGNYPAAERYASAVLKHRPVVPTVHRIGAHHLMTLTKRKRGRPLDALLHGWEAIDMLPADDVRALEVMLSLSEIAIELRDLHAAEMGFASVLEQEGPSRIRLSALVGAVASCVHSNRGDSSSAITVRLRQYQARLVQLLDAQLSPRDRCRGLVALAEIHRHFGEHEAAAKATDNASAIAHEFGFFEQQFRLDAFIANLAAPTHPTSSTQPNTPSIPEERTITKRHPALSRLVNLAAH